MSPKTIINAAFTASSDFGSILVVCLEDKHIVIFEPNELIKLKSINVEIPNSNASVSSINMELGKHIIIGYNNGLAKMFHLKSSKEEREFKVHYISQNQREESGANDLQSGINHIRISERHKLAFLAHEEHLSLANGEFQKLKKTPIHAFNYDSGEFVSEYKIPNLSIKSMKYLD